MTQKEIVCAHCGQAEPALVEEPVVLGCSHCLKITEFPDGAPVKGRQPSRTKYSPSPHWLRVGAQLDYKGKRYTLHAVYQHSVSWNEWDSEDSAFERGLTPYLEWYFVAKDGTEFCLEQTDSEYKFQLRQSIAFNPKWAEEVQRDKNVTKPPEYGTYHLLGFWGQDDEPLDTAAWNYYILERRTAYYTSIEWKDGMPVEEWQASELRQISVLELERWKVRTQAEIDEAAEKVKTLGFFRQVFGWAALVMFFLMLYSVGTQRKLCHSSWNFSAPKHDTLYNANYHGKSFCKVRLEPGRPYRFESKCDFPSSNASVSFSVSILKMPEGTPVNTIAAAFYSETGRDSEGDWTEATLSDYFNFVAPEQAEYEVYVRVLPESNDSTDSAESHSGVLTVDVYPIMLSRFFVLFMLVFALVWLILQWRWEYQALQSDKHAHTWLQNMFK